MATLKCVSAMARSHVAAAVRIWQSSVLDGPASNLCPASVVRRTRQESVTTVCCSSPVSHRHHYRGLENSQLCVLDNKKLDVISHAASSTPNQHDRRYICPSRLGQLFSHLVIMDNVSDVQRRYDCPVPDTANIRKITPSSQTGKTEIVEAPERRGVPDSKEAKEIMRIRHKKMKKHKLRKLRKRMYFLWKKQKATRKAKRDAIYWREISDIKKQAEDFSAEDFVKEQLEKARKGGFYMKVLDSKV